MKRFETVHLVDFINFEAEHMNTIDFLQHLYDFCQLVCNGCVILKDFDYVFNLFKENAEILHALLRILLGRKCLLIATIFDSSPKLTSHWIAEGFDVVTRMVKGSVPTPPCKTSSQTGPLSMAINAFLTESQSHNRTKGILLYGPPGVGKTASVRELCKETGVQLRHVSMHHILRAELGESEAQLRSFFEDTSIKTVVFIDEIDAVFTKATKNERLVMELYSCFENISPTLLVIAATNLLDAIPRSLRIGTQFAIEIEFSGNEVNRQQIIHEQFGTPPFLVSRQDCIDKLAKVTSSLSVADLRMFLNRIKIEFSRETRHSELEKAQYSEFEKVQYSEFEKAQYSEFEKTQHSVFETFLEGKINEL